MRWWAVAFWLAVWQIGSMALDQQILLVSPIRAAIRLTELIGTALFWRAIGYSCLRILVGFALGMTAGTLLAVLAARVPWAEELLQPLMAAVRSIPVASFIILALIFFSSANLSVLISFLMVVPIFYASVGEGIRAQDPLTAEMARVFEIPAWRRMRYVTLPQLFPFFRSACTAGLGLSWKSGVAAEIIGIPAGSIGEQLQQAKAYLDTPDLFAWTAMIVGISLLCERAADLLLGVLQRRTERIGP